MSEYQFYEFQALDRPLTEREQQTVANLSSRVSPHPTRAIFVYNYGDFRGKPMELLAQYYDAFFYIANWANARLAFRFPIGSVDLEAMQAYRVMDAVSIEQINDEYVIVDIEYSAEEGYSDWVEGEGSLGSLLGLRDALMAGDYRVLYLAWLMALKTVWEVDLEQTEPPVPAGLKQLNTSLRNFIDLFEVNKSLVAAAAKASPSKDKQKPDVWANAINQLGAEEQRAWLLRLAENEPALGRQFYQRLREFLPSDQKMASSRRTAQELIDLGARLADEAAEKKRVAAQKKLKKEMEAFAPHADKIWEMVEKLVAQKKTSAYDEAVVQLKRLKGLAIYQGNLPQFRANVAGIRGRYPRLTGLHRRLESLK